MNLQNRDRWGVLNVIVLGFGVAAIWQGCNVFAGLDDVKFETGGSAGAGGAGMGGTTTSSTTTGVGAGGTTTLSAQGGTAGTGAGGTLTTSSTGGVGAGGTTTSTTTTTVGVGGMSTSSTTSTTSSTGGTGGAPTNDVDCGSGQTCAVGTQICCWDHLGNFLPTNTGKCVDIPFSQMDCDNSDTPTGEATTVYCQSNDDCTNGDVCCATLDFSPSFHFITAECKATCTGTDERIVCKGAGDMTSCMAGDVCNPSMSLPPGYYTCQ